MRRRAVVATALLAAVACTGQTATESPAPSPSRDGLPAHVTVLGRSFDVSCTPVAEALVDIKLPHETGQPLTRAITGLWDHQAIAVLANDHRGCGMWVLGLAKGLSPEATDAILAEVANGVQRFGVTASPVPRD